MATIQDVAKTYVKSVGKAIFPGVPYSGYKTGSSKAFKTGKMLAGIVAANTPDKLARKTKKGWQLVLDLQTPSPKNYAIYVHYGTYKMKARPFGELGTQDPAFELALNEYFGNETMKLVEDLLQPIDTQFQSAGFKVS
jgi:hypothetical protein